MSLDKEKEQQAIELSKKLAEQFDAEETEEFLEYHKNEKWYDDFLLLFKMITDKDFKMKSKTKMVIAGALAYLVFPIDIIPDFIPIIGFLDDIFVLNFVKNAIADEIERYKEFKGEKWWGIRKILYRQTQEEAKYF